METSVMIRQLRATAKKHEKDVLHTFDTNISAMCTDVANRLEELEKEKAEIRAKAIEDFAEAVKAEILPMLHTEEEFEIAEKALEDISKELKGE